MRENQLKSVEAVPQERILLVVVEMHKPISTWHPAEILKEMSQLVVACGGTVIDAIIFRSVDPTPRYLIGDGRVHEVEEAVKRHQVDTVIFSQDLKGSQQRNIEDVLQVKTIDRTQLILDIFARHARSREGKLQVELAQLTYLLPRLVGKGVELSRLGGGIGTLGPGETKLELDRRRITNRITRLKKNLQEVVANRSIKRKKRKGRGLPALSLVGYTNAGKSSLLNALTDARQVTHDGFFTTLDSLSRQLILPNHQRVVVSDTVGFMHDLPHHLIESFKATLEEVREADILLQVLDVSDVNFRLRYEAVEDVLKQMELVDKPVITILNKIDRVDDLSFLGEWEERFRPAVAISALKHERLDLLLEVIVEQVAQFVIEIDVNIPIGRMDLVNLAHEQGEVYAIKYYNDKINIRAVVPRQIAGRFEPGK